MRVATVFGVVVAVVMAAGAQAQATDGQAGTKVTPPDKAVEAPHPRATSTPDSVTEGSVTVGGQKIAYRAIAGTITVGGTDSYDAMLGLDGALLADAVAPAHDPAKPDEAPATARMFYTAYLRKDAREGAPRPVMFIYNGGPGSSTMWLHMGSFGPRRIVIPDTEHQAAAPYSIVENQYSLLDVTDLVFIDMPGAGLSRIQGKDKEKAFWGIDPDAHAFERFIRRFLTKYDRWNSPKYLFGESYGTPRSAVLSAMLQSVDLNGIVLLSAILAFDNSPDAPRWNPGIDQPYALALPTYAAIAAYHHKLPTQPPALEPFLKEVEEFALGEYSSALLAGSTLTDARLRAVAEKLHTYTGLPVDYLVKANLRVAGGAFSKNLGDSEGITTGRLDGRYRGPDLNRLSEQAEYDPTGNAMASAYAAAINSYLRTELKYGRDLTYKANIYGETGFAWDLRHQAPGGPPVGQGESGTNVIPDLAFAMKSNPKMRVLLAGGYYDLATPFFQGMFEMRHMDVPKALQQNVVYRYYESGHMVYVNEGILKRFHDDVAAFVKETEAGK